MAIICVYDIESCKVKYWSDKDAEGMENLNLPLGHSYVMATHPMPEANFVVDGKPTKVVIPLSDAELIKSIEDEVTKFLNATAKVHGGWDSIGNAVGAAGISGPFQAQALTLANWWSEVWSFCFAELDKFKAGLRGITSPAKFITELPPYQS